MTGIAKITRMTWLQDSYRMTRVTEITEITRMTGMIMTKITRTRR